MAPSIPDGLRKFVRERAEGCCEYCQAPERYVGIRHQIDHIRPRSLGGQTEADNLCLACSACNGTKHAHTVGHDPQSGLRVTLFHPRNQTWQEHFTWDVAGAEVIGLTETGRATVETLHLNNELARVARSLWRSMGWQRI